MRRYFKGIYPAPEQKTHPEKCRKRLYESFGAFGQKADSHNNRPRNQLVNKGENPSPILAENNEGTDSAQNARAGNRPFISGNFTKDSARNNDYVRNQNVQRHQNIRINRHFPTSRRFNYTP